MINAFDPREITVIGFVDTNLEEFRSKLDIDVEQRLYSSLDDMIEIHISRTFGLLVSEDDFSAAGDIAFKPASIAGSVTDFGEVARRLKDIASAIAEVSQKRDATKKARDIPS